MGCLELLKAASAQHPNVQNCRFLFSSSLGTSQELMHLQEPEERVNREVNKSYF